MARTTKTTEMLVALQAGDSRKALRLAQGFRLGITTSQRKIIATGYMCLGHPGISRQLGKDPSACTAQAIQLLRELYARRLEE